MCADKYVPPYRRDQKYDDVMKAKQPNLVRFLQKEGSKPTLGDSGNFVEAFDRGGVWTVNLSRESDVNLKFPVRFKPYW